MDDGRGSLSLTVRVLKEVDHPASFNPTSLLVFHPLVHSNPLANTSSKTSNLSLKTHATLFQNVPERLSRSLQILPTGGTSHPATHMELYHHDHGTTRQLRRQPPICPCMFNYIYFFNLRLTDFHSKQPSQEEQMKLRGGAGCCDVCCGW